MSMHEEYCKEIADEFIAMLEAGTAPWQQEWDAGKVGALNYNGSTQMAYKGINQLFLDAKAFRKGYKDPRWLTYNQAKELGYQVRKDERHTKIEYWKIPTSEEKKEITAKKGLTEKDLWKLSPRPFFAQVFNGEQIEGLEPYVAPEIDSNFSPIPEGKRILKETGITIEHRGSRAFYRPSEDKVGLPIPEAFDSEAGYYAAALHEIGHATGHSTRLDRKFGVRGSSGYAREELRAEISSYMVAKTTGLPHNPHNQASYVASWIKDLKDDPREIFKACKDANLIKEWILEPEKRPELEQRAQAQTQAKTRKVVTSSRIEAVAMSKPKISPEESLQSAMHEMGLKPREIIMDGNWHRCSVEGDSQGKASGSYKAYNDGIPNAVITNHKTSEQLKWRYDGHNLSKEELTTLRDEGEARKQERVKEREAQQEKAAKTAYGLWENANIAKPDNHPYLKRKGVDNYDELLRVNEKTGSLFIPVYSPGEKLQSLQIIEEDGEKRFLKDGKLEDGMLWLKKREFSEETKPIGIIGIAPSQKKPNEIIPIVRSYRTSLVEKPIQLDQPIIIAESYTTAKSIHDATGATCVIAFSAHQMKNIAEVIHRKQPKTPLILAADDDRDTPEKKANREKVAKDLGQPVKPFVSIGITKAEEAAKAVNGKIIVPSFTKEEKERGFTDFNDLAQSRGNKEIKKQFNKVLNKQKSKEMELV